MGIMQSNNHPSSTYHCILLTNHRQSLTQHFTAVWNEQIHLHLPHDKGICCKINNAAVTRICKALCYILPLQEKLKLQFNSTINGINTFGFKWLTSTSHLTFRTQSLLGSHHLCSSWFSHLPVALCYVFTPSPHHSSCACRIHSQEDSLASWHQPRAFLQFNYAN